MNFMEKICRRMAAWLGRCNPNMSICWFSPIFKVRFGYVTGIPVTNAGRFLAVVSTLNKKDRS